MSRPAGDALPTSAYHERRLIVPCISLHDQKGMHMHLILVVMHWMLQPSHAQSPPVMTLVFTIVQIGKWQGYLM